MIKPAEVEDAAKRYSDAELGRIEEKMDAAIEAAAAWDWVFDAIVLLGDYSPLTIERVTNFLADKYKAMGWDSEVRDKVWYVSPHED